MSRLADDILTHLPETPIRIQDLLIRVSGTRNEVLSVLMALRERGLVESSDNPNGGFKLWRKIPQAAQE